MNKKILIGVGVVVIVLLVWWRMGSSSDGGMMGNPQSMRSFLGAGAKAQECTYTTSVGGTQTSGTVYFRDGKMRSNFDTTVNGTSVASHMIIDGQTMYSWNDVAPMGIKMMLPATASPAAGSVQQGLNLDATGKFDCKAKTPDANLFMPPTSVQFTEYGQTGAAAGAASAQCQACAQVPESARAQCLAMFACK